MRKYVLFAIIAVTISLFGIYIKRFYPQQLMPVGEIVENCTQTKIYR